MLKYIFPIILFFFAADSCGQVFVSMKMDTNQIYIGEQVLLKLKVTAGSNQIIVMPEYPDSQLVEGIEVLGHYTEKKENLDGGKRQSIIEAYQITSFDSSLYYIPPIEVQVDGSVYKSRQGQALKVVSPSIDTTKVDKINGPMENARVFYDWNDLQSSFLLWFVGAVLLVAAIYMALQIKNNHRIVPKITLKSEGPPHKVAMKHLSRLKRRNWSSTDDTHLFYTELTDILRIYIGKRFGFKATAMTTAQILGRLADSTPRQLLAELAELFEATDLIKYAGMSGSDAEKDKNLMVAVEYVNTTKEEPGGKKNKEYVAPEIKRSYKVRVMLVAANYIIVLTGCGLIAWSFYTVYNMLY